MSGLLACSSMNALLVAMKPYSDRKVAIEAIRGEGMDAAGLVCWIGKPSVSEFD